MNGERCGKCFRRTVVAFEDTKTRSGDTEVARDEFQNALVRSVVFRFFADRYLEMIGFELANALVLGTRSHAHFYELVGLHFSNSMLLLSEALVQSKTAGMNPTVVE